MKPRERPATGGVPAPPLALRLWDDPSWQRRGEGLGCEVYASREEWLGARATWAAGHGLTVEEWFTLACDDAAGRGGLDGLGAVFGEYLTAPDDYQDPRELTGMQMRERTEARMRAAGLV